MLCWECGAEMRLVQVVEDTTMLVSGYKHHTWQCSSCSAVERRMTFTRGKTPTPMMEPTQTMAAEPTQTAPVRTAEPVEPAQRVTVETRQTVSVEPAPTASVKTTVSVEATQKEAVETTQQVPVQPTIQNRQSLSLQRIARAKERARSLKERVTVPREAADEAKRRAQFKVFWDNLLLVPSSSISSEELSSVKAESTTHDEPSGGATFARLAAYVAPEKEHAHIGNSDKRPSPSSEPDEPVLSPAEPNASSALTAHDEPSRGATLAQLADCVTPNTEGAGSVNSVEQPRASSEPSSHVTSSEPVRSLAEPIASPPPRARDELSSTVTSGHLADCVMSYTEHAGIASSVEQPCPSSEPLSHAKPDEPVQAPVEPIASAPRTAPDEPSGPEERLERPRRWWNLKKVGLTRDRMPGR